MVEIVMPKSGITMEEGTIVHWNFKIGDTIHKGDLLASIETDKSVLDLESPATGVLEQILVQEDETVAVGIPIAMLRESGE